MTYDPNKFKLVPIVPELKEKNQDDIENIKDLNFKMQGINENAPE